MQDAVSVGPNRPLELQDVTMVTITAVRSTLQKVEPFITDTLLPQYKPRHLSALHLKYLHYRRNTRSSTHTTYSIMQGLEMVFPHCLRETDLIEFG